MACSYIDALQSSRKRKRKGETRNLGVSRFRVNLDGKKDGSQAGSMDLAEVEHIVPRRGKVIATLKKLRDDQESARVQRPGKNLGRKVVSRSSIGNPRVVLARLVEKKVVLLGAEVYYDGGKGRSRLAKGWIASGGIKCSCCNEVFTLTRFEAHAGSTNHRPAANIFLQDGRSLVDCQRQLVSGNKMTQGEGKRGNLLTRNSNRLENHELCCVCHSGGELICCDHCRSTYHRRCLCLKFVPVGNWFCPLCCCGICGELKFEQRTLHSLDDDAVRTCYQCEHKFHMGCIRKSKGGIKLKSQSKWFCSERCDYVFSGLHKLIGKPFSLGAKNLTWRLLKSLGSDHQDNDVSADSEFLKEMQRKLVAAVDVMHECFESAKDPYTGRDLVEDVIFNRRSEEKKLSYGGFYTVVLEMKGKIVSVATVRVYENVAEVPFVATRFKNRRHGMCQLMMGELEKQLIALGVESLILPSAPSVLTAWTTKFGFSKMTNYERSKYSSYSFLYFQDTIMCQKLLMKIPSADSCRLSQAGWCAATDPDRRFHCFSPVSVLKGEESE
ncbi:increased DNA methylation 1-like [Melia azedarach]|uniref:Increased DNA methylation 1-like n=1 Tax=Melia azedarach TaxID=155640 RepID=A0ACC1X1W0_MELAZ|nr:increased DNA methylation 1-like [Melia azedarach]